MACAPLGWDNLLVSGVSGRDHAQVEHAPVMTAYADNDHVTSGGYAMVDRPPWEQFDLDANDYLIDSNPKYWNTVEGPSYKDFPTAGAIAPSIPGSQGKADEGTPVLAASSVRKPAKQSPDNVIPAMPLLVNEDSDPYGSVCPTGILYRDSSKDTERK